MNKSIWHAVIVTAILIGGLFIYEGYGLVRKENIKDKDLLSKRVLNDNKGMYQKKGLIREGDTYYFKGEVYNNYVQIFNRLYRIISITKDNIKIVSNVNEAVFYYGSGDSYLNSNIYLWLNQTEVDKTGVYSKTIPAFLKFVVKSKYFLYQYDSSLTKMDILEDYFTILNIDDYMKAGGEDSFFNNGSASFLLGYDKDKRILVMQKDGKVDSTSRDKASGIRVVMTLKKGLKVLDGDGTIQKPYVIDQESYINDINKYIQLDKDLYQVYEENDNYFRLRMVDYLSEKRSFSNKLSGFRPLNKNNIAYYLNHTYYNSLSYKDILEECRFNTGDLMDKYDYLDSFSTVSSVKVGMQNIFDLNISNFLSDYYLINASKDDFENSYVYDKFGTIQETKATTLKRIIPVVCIKKDLVKRGDGSLKNPYIVE